MLKLTWRADYGMMAMWHLAEHASGGTLSARAKRYRVSHGQKASTQSQQSEESVSSINVAD